MAVGRLIFMVVFTPLTSYASPSHFYLGYYSAKQFELLVSKLKNIHIDCVQYRL